jgi:hypothetical protein
VITYSPGGDARKSINNGDTPEILAPAKGPSPAVLAETARALQLIESAQVNGGIMSTVQDPFASLLQTYIAKLAPENQLEEAPGGALEARFDEHDVLGWASSVFTWWKKLRKFAWREPDGLPTPLGNKARVAVFGDWATGLYGAPEVAGSIAKEPYRLVLHLGDTYYSGDDDEVADRLMRVWPRSPHAIHRALNGNHEMYTGGNAYMEAVEREFGQTSSYFALQNDYWTLACLDTAYSDQNLHGRQAEWLQSLIQAASGRRLILFSHHQPFSLRDTQGHKLAARLAAQLETRQVYAWYWGHEHRCALYEPHPVWGFLGRCAGHGGFPYFRSDSDRERLDRPVFVRHPSRNLAPGAEILDGPNPLVPGFEADYGPHGFLTLEFDGPRLHEFVRDAFGNVLRERTIAE